MNQFYSADEALDLFWRRDAILVSLDLDDCDDMKMEIILHVASREQKH